MERVPLFIGQRFERLVVLELLGASKRKHRCRARCDCGTEKVVAESDLRSGTIKSCGCLRRDRAHALNRTHRQGGVGRTPLYRAWEAMRDRPRRIAAYQALGVTVDPAWAKSFEVFRDYVVEHLGPRPHAHTIDRIENTKGYVPGNIRWASAKQQARNRRDNTIITVDGVSRCIAEWSEVSGISSAVICARLKRGWDPALAVTAPLRW